MEGCAVPAPIDAEELIVKSYIGRMLSDNYTLLIVFIITTALLVFVLSYFVKQIFATYKDYQINAKRSEMGTNASENEVYTDGDMQEVADPGKYQKASKLDFFKAVDSLYQQYNIEKTNYIKATYGHDNDDYIENTMSYKRYDNYDYRMPNQH